MKKLRIIGYLCLIYLLAQSPVLLAADIAFIKSAANGAYYFKMSATGAALDQMEGAAFKVTPGDRDEVLWRTAGWFSDNIFLTSDGSKLVRIEEDKMYLYESGKEVASRPAGSTSLGQHLQINAARSGFRSNERDFLLVTASGKSEIFSLEINSNESSKSVGLHTIARRVESTVSYDKSVRNYAEVRVKVEGQNRSSRSTVANSVSAKQSASTLIGVQTRDRTKVSEPASGKPAAATIAQKAMSDNPVSVPNVVQQVSDPITNTGKYECRVEAQLFASATRKKVTSRRQIHQSGATEEMATDRAMAYCEGVVGAGSRMPRGRCELRECTNQGASSEQ